MADTMVTVVRCRRCGRSGELSLHEDRFWCAWCQDWAALQPEQVRDAMIEREVSGPRLVPKPQEELPLQALRIPAGWLVDYNNGLYEVDPSPERVPEEDRWWVFKQDMLQMRHERSNRLLDLGWYPEGDLIGGHYGLVVYEGDFHGRLLHEFTTSDRLLLVAEIERLLRAVCNGEL